MDTGVVTALIITAGSTATAVMVYLPKRADRKTKQLSALPSAYQESVKINAEIVRSLREQLEHMEETVEEQRQQMLAYRSAESSSYAEDRRKAIHIAHLEALLDEQQRTIDGLRAYIVAQGHTVPPQLNR